jgi:YHS domain-containing protein
MATDPICGMMVDSAQAAGRYQDNGEICYFARSPA